MNVPMAFLSFFPGEKPRLGSAADPRVMPGKVPTIGARGGLSWLKQCHKPLKNRNNGNGLY